MENLTLTAKIVSSYQKNGKVLNAYSLNGSPSAIATYKADMIKELGKCPLVDGTDLPRFTSTSPLGDQFTLERGTSGKWYSEFTVERVLGAELAKPNLNPLVAQAIANAYTDNLVANIKSMLNAKRRVVNSSEQVNNEPIVTNEKKVDDVF